MCQGFFQVPDVQALVGEIVQRRRTFLGSIYPIEQRQGALGQRPRPVLLPQAAGEKSLPVEGDRHEQVPVVARVVLLGRLLQAALNALQHGASLPQTATDIVKIGQDLRTGEQNQWTSVLRRPRPADANVVHLTFYIFQPRNSRALEDLGFDPPEQGGVVDAVAFSRSTLVFGVSGELLGRVVPDQFVQPQTSRGPSLHERTVDQFCHGAQRRPRYPLRGLQRKPPAEDGELTQYDLLPLCKPPPGCLEDHPHAAVAFRGVTRRRDEQIEVPDET